MKHPNYHRLLLLVVPVLLAGCPTQQELATALSGSWQGQSGDQRWCLSLSRDAAIKTGEGRAIYQSMILNEQSPAALAYASGIWLVGVGGRWQLNLNPHPLDENLQAMPARENRVESIRYLIKGLDNNQLQYVEHKPDDSFGETYSSSRVDSCDSFFANAKPSGAR